MLLLTDIRNIRPPSVLGRLQNKPSELLSLDTFLQKKFSIEAQAAARHFNPHLPIVHERSFSMFNRDNLFGGRSQQPQQPPSRSPQPPSRGPDPRYQQHDPYAQEPKGYPPPGNMRSPPPSQGHQRSHSGGQRIQMRPAKSPDNTFTFGNISAVSAQDIPPSHEVRNPREKTSAGSPQRASQVSWCLKVLGSTP